jgi:hypothetical protein
MVTENSKEIIEKIQTMIDEDLKRIDNKQITIGELIGKYGEFMDEKILDAVISMMDQHSFNMMKGHLIMLKLEVPSFFSDES